MSEPIRSQSDQEDALRSAQTHAKPVEPAEASPVWDVKVPVSAKVAAAFKGGWGACKR